MQALKNFRTLFLRGMAALLPTIVTIWVFAQCYTFVQTNISTPINRGLVRILVKAFDWYPDVTEQQRKDFVLERQPTLSEDKTALQRRITQKEVVRDLRIQVAEQYWVYGPGRVAGFIIAMIAVVILGAFLASFIGRSLWRLVEKAFLRLPLIKQVYHPVRQITDFLLTKKDFQFNKVVALQYPRPGVWAIGLVTGKGLSRVNESQKREFLTVFLPTSPTPFTGYVMLTPREETIELDMTIEEALRFTVSGGVITPAQSDAFEEFRSGQKESLKEQLNVKKVE